MSKMENTFDRLSTGMIPESDARIPDVGLGSYVAGYDSSKESMSLGMYVMALLFGTFFIVGGLPVLGLVPKVDYLSNISLVLGCVLVVVATLYKTNVLPLSVQRVFVYEHGFVWQKAKKDGTVVSQEKVDFNDADGVGFSKTHHYTNGGYTNTTYELTVSKKGKDIFKKSGSYTKEDVSGGDEGRGWESLSLQAIVDRWTQLGLVRVGKELSSKGFVRFFDNVDHETIEVGRDYIKVGDRTVRKENIKYEFSDGRLLIDDGSKKRGMMNGHEISIDVRKMINNQIFLNTISSLLDIR